MVVVLSRGGQSPARLVAWDGRTRGDWFREIDGSDVVINLAGRTVNCRYTAEHLREMLESRVDSVLVDAQIEGLVGTARLQLAPAALVGSAGAP